MAAVGGALRCGGRTRGGARVGSKSRCPLAPRCRATSTSRHLLCGSRALRIAAAYALVAARWLPRPAPPSRAVCWPYAAAGAAAGAAAPLCSISVCRAAWDKTQPWCAEIASAGGCARPARGGVAGSKPRSGTGVRASALGLFPSWGCQTTTPAMERKPRGRPACLSRELDLPPWEGDATFTRSRMFRSS